MFLGLQGSGSISQRHGSGSGSFYQQAKTLISIILWLLYDFLSLIWLSLQKLIRKTTLNTKIAGSDSQRNGSADPYQNVTDPQHWPKQRILYPLPLTTDRSPQGNYTTVSCPKAFFVHGSRTKSNRWLICFVHLGVGDTMSSNPYIRGSRRSNTWGSEPIATRRPGV
jgi:hypothetical protein